MKPFKPLILLLIAIVIGHIEANSQRRGPNKSYENLSRIHAKSRGRPFPLPQTFIPGDIQRHLDERKFVFKYASHSHVCDVVTIGFNRYHKIIFRHHETEIRQLFGNSDVYFKKAHNKTRNGSPSNELTRLIVSVKEPCEEYPSLESDESYTLIIAGNDYSNIEAKTVWGALRALETFSQLIVVKDGLHVINDTFIMDYPRFKHRGVLLDSSRHYLDPNIIKVHLEALAANKMNVFHWHIVDDESFPYQSYTFPELSEKGAYDPYYHVYTQEVIKEIIEFARLRGIRVVPEFDSPGHTQSWGKSFPTLLTSCFDGQSPNGQFGPIDPTNNFTYTFWKSFIKELVDVFPDRYLHLGGDEVDFTCWQSNPEISKFMDIMKYNDDYRKLEEYYEQTLLNIVQETSPKTNYIVWQEVIDNNVKVKPETVVQVWKGEWEEEIANVTALGYRALLSSCWYLDYISYGSDWINYYKCDPMNFTGTYEQKQLVIGGEACIWGEFVDGTNVIQRTWPRASAVAERLWSSEKVNEINDASTRLEEHRCRMIRRGINAQPFDGSGFCDNEFTLR